MNNSHFKTGKICRRLVSGKEAAIAGISVAKSDLYPSIALTAGNITANIPGLVAVRFAGNVGVGLKYDLSSLWKSKANIDAAKSHVTEITANEAQLSDDIRLQVNQSFEDYLLSQKKTEVLKKQLGRQKKITGSQKINLITI